MIFSPFAYRQEQVVTPTPSIPTNGLTLYLDAGNVSSYPGSGTVWYDLSGNNNNGTLTNGATYVSTFGGSIQFDGVNDYISFSSVNNMPTGNTEYTLISFMKKNVSTRRDGIIGWGTFTNRQYLGFRTMGPSFESDGLLTYWYADDFPVNTTITTNTWYSMVSKYDKVLSQRQMLINNSSIGTNTPSGNINIQTQSGLVVGASNLGNGLDDYINGNISVMMVYNRALTNTELTSIWNYFKGRYGY